MNITRHLYATLDVNQLFGIWIFFFLLVICSHNSSNIKTYIHFPFICILFSKNNRHGNLTTVILALTHVLIVVFLHRLALFLSQSNPVGTLRLHLAVLSS